MTKKTGSKLSFWKRNNVRSGLEKSIKEELERKGVNFGYENIKLRYAKLSCKSCGECVEYGTYTPDFTFQRSGRTLFVEIKGRFTSQDRTKMRLVRKAYPEHDIRIVFQRNHPLRKGSTTHYTDWAAKVGFPCIVGNSIPEEWYNDQS